MIVALPTARGGVFLFAAAGSVAVAFINPGLATALCAATLGGITLAGFVMAQFSVYFAAVSRAPGGDGMRHTAMTLPVTVRNRAFFFRQPAILREACPFVAGLSIDSVVPPLGPFEEVTMQRKITPLKRGHYLFDSITLSGGDPSGLFRRSRRFRLSGEIMIRPESVPIDGIPLRRGRQPQPSKEGRPLGVTGTGQDFFGVRPYRPGDEMRFIHWKATAAKRKLMVKEFEANTIDRITILLDTRGSDIGRDPHENNFEMQVTIAASLAAYLQDLYCQLTFCCFNENGELQRLSGDAAGMYNSIVELLTLLRPGKNSFETLLADSLETIAPGSMVYALTLSQSEEMGKLFNLLAEYEVDIRWIYAPLENFPTIARDVPRIIDPARIHIVENAPVRPRLAAFNSNVNELLRNPS